MYTLQRFTSFVVCSIISLAAHAHEEAARAPLWNELVDMQSAATWRVGDMATWRTTMTLWGTWDETARVLEDVGEAVWLSMANGLIGGGKPSELLIRKDDGIILRERIDGNERPARRPP